MQNQMNNDRKTAEKHDRHESPKTRFKRLCMILRL